MIICDGQGSVGYSNYMRDDFIGSTTTSIGYDEEINQIRAMFIVTCLDLDRYKYSYGRKYRSSMNSAIIKLPVQRNPDGIIIKDKSKKYSNEGYIPDWQFMEDYIKSLHHKPLTTKNKYTKAPELNTDTWKFFFLKDLCQISMGNKLDHINMTKDEPCVNFIGRSAGNNGVADKVDLIAGITPYRAGCITVALGGSLGSAYLQMEDFYTSQNVAVLSFGEEINNNAKLFLTTSIMNESKYKYFPFGRELNTHIRTDFGFALPIKCDSKGVPIIDKTHQYSDKGYVPDWQFMEDYIKSLPYGDRI